MSYNLFLDDERTPHKVTWVELPLVEWKVVKNYDEFVRTICAFGLPLRVSFDHDLALEHYPFMEVDGGISNPTTIPYDSYKEKTGYHCAKWLVSYCMDRGHAFPEYYVHTMNPIGKENIIKYIENFKRS